MKISALKKIVEDYYGKDFKLNDLKYKGKYDESLLDKSTYADQVNNNIDKIISNRRNKPPKTSQPKSLSEEMLRNNMKKIKDAYTRTYTNKKTGKVQSLDDKITSFLYAIDNKRIKSLNETGDPYKLDKTEQQLMNYFDSISDLDTIRKKSYLNHNEHTSKLQDAMKNAYTRKYIEPRNAQREYLREQFFEQLPEEDKLVYAIDQKNRQLDKVIGNKLKQIRPDKQSDYLSELGDRYLSKFDEPMTPDEELENLLRNQATDEYNARLANREAEDALYETQQHQPSAPETIINRQQLQKQYRDTQNPQERAQIREFYDKTNKDAIQRLKDVKHERNLDALGNDLDIYYNKPTSNKKMSQELKRELGLEEEYTPKKTLESLTTFKDDNGFPLNIRDLLIESLRGNSKANIVINKIIEKNPELLQLLQNKNKIIPKFTGKNSALKEQWIKNNYDKYKKRQLYKRLTDKELNSV